MRRSYIFGELISCLRLHMSPMCLECPQYNGWSLLLSETIVVRSWDFGEYFWDGDYFDILIWSIIYVMVDASIFLKSSMKFIIFISHVSWLAIISCLLDAVVVWMMTLLTLKIVFGDHSTRLRTILTILKQKCSKSNLKKTGIFFPNCLCNFKNKYISDYSSEFW